jgi:large subunit ribosomal protein L24
MKIKKNDNVIVIAGKDKGKTGKVLRILSDQDKVIVEGINLAKRHIKSRASGKKGERVEKTMPVHVSNVMLIDPKTGKGTRVGYKVEGDKKVRIAKKSGEKIA